MNNPERFESRADYKSLIAAASLLSLVHLSLDYPGFNLTHEIRLGIIALVSVSVIFLLFKYMGSTYPFWRIQKEPSLKPFVFLARGLFILTMAISSLFLADYLKKNQFPWSIYSLYYFSAVITFAGIYDLYVFLLARKLKIDRNIVKKWQNETSSTLDTGKLADEQYFRDNQLYKRSGFFLGKRGKNPVFYDKAVHLITYGQPGCGKTTSSVIPNLINWQSSAFVVDCKGELAAQTASYRRDVLGQKVYFINPWQMHGLPNDAFNPLQMLLDDVKRTKQPGGDLTTKNKEFDDAEVICNIILPEPPDAGVDNKWVREDGRQILKALMLYLTTLPDDQCNLVNLRSMLMTDDEELGQILTNMFASNAYGNELSMLANSLLNRFIETRQTFEHGRNEALTALKLYSLASPNFANSLMGSVFSMDSLKERPTTVYLMVPKDFINSHGSWMGLVVSNAIESIGRTAPANREVMLMMDEFANMGKLPIIEKALAIYRSYGLRGWMIVQNQRQLRKVYGDNDALSLEQHCNVQQYLQVGSEMAENLSRNIGNKTVKSQQVSGSDREFSNVYAQKERSHTEQARPILSTSEIMNLGNEQIVFTDGTPMKIEKCPYWQISPWRDHIEPNPLEGSANFPKNNKNVIKIK